MGLMSLLLLCSTRRTVRKSLLEEVQELEARAVDPEAAVLRDASGRRYLQYSVLQAPLDITYIHPSNFICVINQFIPLIFFVSFVLRFL